MGWLNGQCAFYRSVEAGSSYQTNKKRVSRSVLTLSKWGSSLQSNSRGPRHTRAAGNVSPSSTDLHSDVDTDLHWTCLTFPPSIPPPHLAVFSSLEKRIACLFLAPSRASRRVNLSSRPARQQLQQSRAEAIVAAAEGHDGPLCAGPARECSPAPIPLSPPSLLLPPTTTTPLLPHDAALESIPAPPFRDPRRTPSASELETRGQGQGQQPISPPRPPSGSVLPPPSIPWPRGPR